MDDNRTPSEAVYDAPASIFSILEGSTNNVGISEANRREVVNRTLSNLSSVSSHPPYTEDNRIIVSQSAEKLQAGSNTSDGSVISVEDATQLTRFYWRNQFQKHHKNQPLFTFYPYRKQYNTSKERETNRSNGSVLKDLVIIIGLITLIVFLVAIFVAVYYGLRSEANLSIMNTALKN